MEMQTAGDDMVVMTLIARAAELAPEDPALIDVNGQTVSYIELLRRIEQAGSSLRELGISRQDRVAVVLPNGPGMAETFLSVASAATCAPLNPALTADDYEFYLSDLAASGLVVSSDSPPHAAAVAQSLGIQTIHLDDLRRGGSAPLDDPGHNDDLALILHTSGTTSRPKLVPLTHTNLCTSAANVALSLGLGAADMCLNVMPLFHIHGLIGVLLASIQTGASVICTSGYDDETFSHALLSLNPTWYSAVPTIHQSVLKLASSRPELAGASRLRLIRSSSASLAPTLMQDLEATFDLPVIEAYGMTEAAHQMASNPLPPAPRKPGSVGLAAGPEIAIMDDAGGLLAGGAVGEIVIRGDNVTRGYLDHPQANAEAFTKGWFRTGDQGYIDADGYLHISGRLKELINRGGEKIVPREVDEALLSHPAVTQAVAFAVPHASLGEALVAAVVVDADVTEAALRDHAFTHLAAFKVPSQILLVNAIPKGPTGKLQRIGLHEKLAGELRVEYQAPRNDIEELVCELWQEVLDPEQIGVNDNFFGLGGDSLSGVRLVNRIIERFEVHPAVESVFRAPTVAGQAELIEQLLIEQLQ